MKRYLFCSFLAALGSALLPAGAQSLPVGTPVIKEVIRISQVAGELNTKQSLMIRSMHNLHNIDTDWLSPEVHSLLIGFVPAKESVEKRKLTAAFIRQQFNSHYPYGWNGGSMIPAKGYQSQLLVGFYDRYGSVSVQLMPELVEAV